jgi:hypothetical protein
MLDVLFECGRGGAKTLDSNLPCNNAHSTPYKDHSINANHHPSTENPYSH